MEAQEPSSLPAETGVFSDYRTVVRSISYPVGPVGVTDVVRVKTCVARYMAWHRQSAAGSLFCRVRKQKEGTDGHCSREGVSL